jgi:hypothetical protein
LSGLECPELLHYKDNAIGNFSATLLFRLGAIRQSTNVVSENCQFDKQSLMFLLQS